MRKIYVDEAGISAVEPVSVVVGVLVEPETQGTKAGKGLENLLELVPPQYRNGFKFHATEIWNSKQLRDAWPFHKRLEVLKILMSFPRQYGMTIGLGIIRRNSAVPVDVIATKKGKPISSAQFQHGMAFSYAMAGVDRFLRRYCPPQESAIIVAEDIPEQRSFFKAAAVFHRANPMVLSNDMLRPTVAEQSSGQSIQHGEFKIERIIGEPSFVKKIEDPLLQIADACAFGFRRYFAEQDYGSEFVRAILGRDLIRDDWAGPGSMGCFRFPRSIAIGCGSR